MTRSVAREIAIQLGFAAAANGTELDELLEIPFSKITTVKFDSRYVEIFSKYV